MSTNFYYRAAPDAAPLHIGKDSSGWNFALRIHPEEGIYTLDDWKRTWAAGGEIADEYGGRVAIPHLLSIITERTPDRKSSADRRYVPYPAIRGGPTWDLCDYEFS